MEIQENKISDNIIRLDTQHIPTESNERKPEIIPFIDENELQLKTLSSKNTIHTYLRIRPSPQNSKSFKFQINETANSLVITNIPPSSSSSEEMNPPTISNKKWNLQNQKCQSSSKKIHEKPQTHKYTFDKVFNASTTNSTVFKEICVDVLDSFITEQKSGLIFTYGVSNSGKTYTIIGNDEHQGILPMTILYINNKISLINSTQNSEQSKITVHCIYIEIYNEKIYDLFSEERTRLHLKERDKLFQLHQPNVEEWRDISLFKAKWNSAIIRKTHMATKCNSYSSRSHSIFKIVLSNGASWSIVDLAGAERTNKAETTGLELSEAKKINTSLVVLGRCFQAMEHNSIYESKMQVPIRESKLTMMFQEYLTGKENVIMITNINPLLEEFAENKNVLGYACVAKEIQPIKSWQVLTKDMTLSSGNSYTTLINNSTKGGTLNSQTNVGYSKQMYMTKTKPACNSDSEADYFSDGGCNYWTGNKSTISNNYKNASKTKNINNNSNNKSKSKKKKCIIETQTKQEVTPTITSLGINENKDCNVHKNNSSNPTLPFKSSIVPISLDDDGDDIEQYNQLLIQKLQNDWIIKENNDKWEMGKKCFEHAINLSSFSFNNMGFKTKFKEDEPERNKETIIPNPFYKPPSQEISCSKNELQISSMQDEIFGQEPKPFLAVPQQKDSFTIENCINVSNISIDYSITNESIEMIGLFDKNKKRNKSEENANKNRLDDIQEESLLKEDRLLIRNEDESQGDVDREERRSNCENEKKKTRGRRKVKESIENDDDSDEKDIIDGKTKARKGKTKIKKKKIESDEEDDEENDISINQEEPVKNKKTKKKVAKSKPKSKWSVAWSSDEENSDDEKYVPKKKVNKKRGKSRRK